VLAVAYDGEDRGHDGAVVFYDISGSEPLVTRIVTGPDFSTPGPDHLHARRQQAARRDRRRAGGQLCADAQGRRRDHRRRDRRAHLRRLRRLRRCRGRAARRRDPPDRARDAGRPAQHRAPSRDLEPEYIAVNAAGTKAYVALQEANALGILDIASGEFESILSFG
jgi:hypothetical protein